MKFKVGDKVRDIDFGYKGKIKNITEEWIGG